MKLIELDDCILNLDYIIAISTDFIGKEYRKPFLLTFETDSSQDDNYEVSFETEEERKKYIINLYTMLDVTKIYT